MVIWITELEKNMEKSNFAEQFRKFINRYKRIGYDPYIMRRRLGLDVLYLAWLAIVQLVDFFNSGSQW